MRARVRLTFASTGPTVSSTTESSLSPREQFWSEFLEKTGRTDAERATESVRLERLLRRRFPAQIQEKLNESLRREAPRGLWPATRSSLLGPPRVKVSLERITYGSIEFWLGIFGLKGEDAANIVWTALEDYAAPTFNEICGTNLILNSEVEIDESDDEVLAQTQAQNRKWWIANTSMIIPVAIGAYILYWLYNGLLHEFEGFRSQDQELRKERADIVKVLVEQNTKLSATLIDHAKSSIANAKVLEKQLVKLVTDRNKTPAKQPQTPDKPDAATTHNVQNNSTCAFEIIVPDGETKSRARHHYPRYRPMDKCVR